MCTPLPVDVDIRRHHLVSTESPLSTGSLPASVRENICISDLSAEHSFSRNDPGSVLSVAALTVLRPLLVLCTCTNHIWSIMVVHIRGAVEPLFTVT